MTATNAPDVVDVLHVTPSSVPSDSSTVSMIWLFAVTTVELTRVTELVPADTATDPAGAAPQLIAAAMPVTAHLFVVVIVEYVTTPPAP